MKNIEILKANLKGTNWSNLRLENDNIVADHNGKLSYAIGGGRTNCYEGTTECYLYPSDKIKTEIFNFGSDQKAFISQELDFKPLGEKNNF